MGVSGSAEALRDDPPDPQPEHSPSFLSVSVLLDQEAAAFAILPTARFTFLLVEAFPSLLAQHALIISMLESQGCFLMGGGGGKRRPEGHEEFKEPRENLRLCSLPSSSSLSFPAAVKVSR